jgi:hypothetical protein
MCKVFSLIVILVLSSKRRANAPIFTATKVVKHSVRTSVGGLVLAHSA